MERSLRMTDAERLEAIIRADAWLWRVLEAARAVDAPDWLVGGGVLRTRVWDALYQVETPTPIADVDMAFFDPADLSPDRDAAVPAALLRERPGIAWEATN